MNKLITSHKKEQNPSWGVTTDSFTGDELIETYFKGCSEGVDQYKKVLLQKLNENLNLAQFLGSSFISSLNSDGVICTAAHLKYMDIERYKIIFIISQDIYFDFERMYPFYEMAEAFEIEKSNNDFNIEVAFIPEVKSINKHRLVSDGFIFHYNGE